MPDRPKASGPDRGQPDIAAVERAVLGACFADPDKIMDIAGEPEGLFASALHRNIRNTLVAMWLQDEDIDHATVQDALRRQGVEVSYAALAAMTNESLSMNYLGDIELLRRYRSKRRVAQVLAKAQQDMSEGVKLPDEVAAETAAALSKLDEGGNARTQRLWSAVNQALIKAEAGAQSEAIPTGLSHLDGALGGGLRKGTLTVIAGRTSMGKSALSTQIALHASTKGHKVLMFSLEMSVEALAIRIAASEAGVEPIVFRAKRDSMDWQRIRQKVTRLADADLWINDDAGMSSDRIILAARQHKARHGLDLVVVDYLQRVNEVLGSTENRNQLLGRITRNMGIFARQADVALILVSQVNRAPDRSSDKRPGLSDLRDSGEIENDADNVLMVYRPGYYDHDKDSSEAEIIIAKQREGRTGSINVRWDEKSVRFYTAEVRYS